MDFDTYLQSKGFAVGSEPPDAIIKQMHAAWLKESSSFQPTAIAVTNPVNTNQVIPVLMTSPSSAMPFPQPTMREGRVNDQGTALVFNPSTGTYSPATNTATGAPVQPTDRSGPDPMVLFSLGPQERAAYLAQFVQPPSAGGGGPADQIFDNVPTASPTPAPTRAPTVFETNFPTPGAAPSLPPGIMGEGAAAPAAPAAPAAAPAFDSVEAVVQAARTKQISKEEAQAILINQFGFDP